MGSCRRRLANFGVCCFIAHWAAASLCPAIAQSPPPPTGTRLVDAIRSTLIAHPDQIIAQQQTQQSQSIVLLQESVFDTSFSGSMGFNRDVLPLGASIQSSYGNRSVADQLDLGLSSSTLLPWGMAIQPGIGLSRSRVGYDPDFVSPTAPTNLASAGLTITQPLLRNAGRVGTAGPLMAARASADRAGLLQQVTARTLAFRTALAYWDWVYAKRRVEVLGASLQRMTKLVADVSALVEEGQSPAADLIQLQAQEAQRRSQEIKARNAEFVAQRSLGEAMGLPFSEIQVLAPPVDVLPSVRQNLEGELRNPEPFIEHALTHRFEIHAQEKHLDSKDILRRTAKRNRLPSVNLEMGLAYYGLVEDTHPASFFTSAGKNIQGLSGGTTLSLLLPAQNRAARSDFLVQESKYRVAEQDLIKLRRSVKISVVQAINSLQTKIKELQFRSDTVRFYEQSVDGEKVKWREGLGTIIDVLLTEDKLTNAVLGQTDAQYQFALGLAQMTFELGRLSFQTEDIADLVPQTLLDGRWLDAK